MRDRKNLNDLGNKLLEYFSVGGLRVAEVDELVQQLVADDKVVPDGLLLHLLEVLLHHLKM